jgi:diadenosine tetraphosphatase ApaH/serine/threonine PP2A family protein phosphatase
MRIAVISDIHANLEALEAVLSDVAGQHIDETLCLGDIVGYGVNPNECVNLVRERCPMVLLGNHDAAAVGMLSTHHFNIHAKIAIEWTTENLEKGARAYLQSLPLRKVQNASTFVHATPYEPNMWYYITSLEEAAFNFQFFETTTCYIGHTHIPIIIVLEEKGDIFVHQDSRIGFAEKPGCRVLINVGSVGQPRDRNPAACYGIIDTDANLFEHRRVPYDVAKAQAKMRKLKMPEFLVMRLQDGR